MIPFLSFAYIRQQPCPFANYYRIGDLQFTEISVSTRTEIASVLDMLGRPIVGARSTFPNSAPCSNILRSRDVAIIHIDQLTVNFDWGTISCQSKPNEAMNFGCIMRCLLY